LEYYWILFACDPGSLRGGESNRLLCRIIFGSGRRRPRGLTVDNVMQTVKLSSIHSRMIRAISTIPPNWRGWAAEKQAALSTKAAALSAFLVKRTNVLLLPIVNG
jgi:hypothetical protein